MMMKKEILEGFSKWGEKRGRKNEKRVGGEECGVGGDKVKCREII